MSQIVSVNRAGRLVLTESGECGVIIQFLDDDGDETGNHLEAKAAVGKLPDGRWFSLDLDAFDGPAASS